MFCGHGVSFFCAFVVVVVAADYSEPDTITGSDPEVTIYRLRTNKPEEILRDDHAAKLAENLVELMMERDYGGEFVKNARRYNFEEKFDNVPRTHHEDQCTENNGNCSQMCQSVGQQAVCSCREGYTLISTTDCAPISNCYTVMSGTSGEFTIRNSGCQWLIKALKHHVIQITLHGSYGYDDYDDDINMGYIYDGDSTRANMIQKIRSSDGGTVLTTSGSNVLIESSDELEDYSYRQSISYATAGYTSSSTLVAGYGCHQNMQAAATSWAPAAGVGASQRGRTAASGDGFQYLELRAGLSGGHITVPSLSKGEDCFSVAYSKPQGASLMVTLNQLYEGRNKFQVITPQFSFQGNDGKWKREIFRIPLMGSDRTWERDSSENQFGKGTREVEFKFNGEGTKVYNLRKCNNLEYHAVGGKQPLDEERVCINGGTWSNTTQSCICPQGFVGSFCEEGCGPNRYGKSCSQVCSFLPSACEGMIFCTEESCSCAPGLQGPQCDSPCDSGNYGVSCQQRCGKCKDDESCDRYTGICYSGCSDGFYPPFCQQTYKVLMNAPVITGVTYNSLKISISFENVTGEGEPLFYEVQYKDNEQTFWSKYSPRKIPRVGDSYGTAEFEMMGLLPGRVYETRVVIIDKNGGSYQIDVPKTKAITKCMVDPIKGDYTFSAKDVNGTAVLLEWSYEHDKTSLTCEMEAFEISVHCGSEHIKFLTTEKKGTKRLSDILPEMRYSFQLVGKTVTGQRTPPIEIEVHTPPAAPGRVRAVKAVPLASGRQLNVTWLPPWSSEHESLRYKVTYQCIRLLACDTINCSSSSGYTKVSTTSALIGHLQPHALYQIEVASVSPSGLLSANYTITAVTADTAPHVTPSPAETPILAVTNTSVSINWKPPEDCSALNGYIYGYSYSLVENDTEEVIQQGTVPENILRVNFSDLVPSHCYDAHITVVSSGGTSLLDELKIPFCTTSTAPDRVQSLSVYKRGRRMVGLRWAPPHNTYGDIESFTVTYSREGSGHSRKLVTEPKHCGAWPDLYCYTVTGLSPGKKYRFEVQARNKDVNIDGEPAAVEAITSEGVSTAPVNLRIINSTENSMLVEWGMPDNINGQLRSFIIIVEQIDTQVDSDECCDEIPLQDYRVTSEEPLYLYEITGLSTASTYSVTVSAKTVTLGEESRIIGHTYPPKASLPQKALVVVNTETSSYKPDVVTLQMYPAERISGVNRKYVLLYLTNDSTAQQPLDEELATLLQSIFTENYHLISEYTQEEIENQSVVTFDLKELGFVSNEIQSQKYALVLIQEYMGNRSVDVFTTEET